MMWAPFFIKLQWFSYDKDFKDGNKWAFSGTLTHSPFSGHKEDKAFYSINRRKTRPFGLSGQKVSSLGAEAWFQQSAGRRDVCPPHHIPSLLRSLSCSLRLSAFSAFPPWSNITLLLFCFSITWMAPYKRNQNERGSGTSVICSASFQCRFSWCFLCRCLSLKFRLVWWGWRLNSQVRIFYFHSNEILKKKKKEVQSSRATVRRSLLWKYMWRIWE